MQVAQGFISSTNTGFAPSTFTSIKSSAPKEALKIDEYSVSYCLTCGKSFTKKYKFCPNCGSCKIKGMLWFYVNKLVKKKEEEEKYWWY